MKVRLKEFLPYIITMIIMFVFMIFTSFIYTNFINSTLQESIYTAVNGEIDNQVVRFAEQLTIEKSFYLKSSVGYTVVDLDKDYTLNDYNFFISQERYVEESESKNSFVYLRLDDYDTKYLKLTLANIVSGMKKSEATNAYGVITDTGSLYSRHGLGGDSLFDIINNSTRTPDSKKTGIKDAMAEGKKNYSLDIDYNSSSYYAAVSYLSKAPVVVNNKVEENNVYFFTLFTPSYFDKLVAQSNNLTLYYRVVLSFSYIVILVDLGLTVLRGNRLFSIRRRSAARKGIAVIKVNKHGKVKYFGRGRDTFGIEITDFDVFKPVDGKTFADSLRRDSRFVANYSLDDGEDAYAEFVSIPQYGGYIVIANIVTEEYLRQEQLRILTEHNSISHLPNRNSLLKNFDSMRSEFMNKQVTLAFIKLVEFEQVSKTLGYTTGDRLLINSVKQINEHLGDGYLYQDNNDTLIVLLNGTYQKNEERLNKFIAIFTRPIQLVKSTVSVHLKIGSYELKNVLNQSFNINDALNKANVALTRAMEQVSVSHVKYDSNLEIYVKYHEQMEEDMHYAIEHDEFVMYFQPQYSVKHRRIEGFESLIRWDNDKYRGVSPQEYIELAEKNGDIVEIGRIINRSVFKAAKSFEPYGVHLSVNVSPAQLMQAGFIDELLTEYKKNELKPGSVCVEITETYLMQNYDLMISKLNILKSNGFSIHLDDFGTGYSSMLYLKELPIDIIKTDMEFIKNLASDEASRIIEAEIIKLAKSLKLEVIAEGVETSIQVQYLEEFGADYLQGYIVSRAVPFDMALNMVKNGVVIEGLKEKGGNLDD